MKGSLVDTWQYFNSEIWAPLADYQPSVGTMPPDLFSDLVAAADDFISPHLTASELEEARNDPDIARQRFFALAATDFRSELTVLRFLEEAYAVITDYEVSGLAERYAQLLAAALEKFNLRYRLEQPFDLKFLVVGSFSNLYAELERLNQTDPHLRTLWADFETAFDTYARGQDDHGLRSSIAKTSNYLEGLASATRGAPGTLGRLCDALTDWPHDKVRDAVKNLYGFCSDYPGIRHAGSPGNVRRALDRRDSVAINISLLALASYLSTSLNQADILGIGTGPSPRASSRYSSRGYPDPAVVSETGLIARFVGWAMRLGAGNARR